MNSFDNTKIAFESKSNKELKRAFWLFKLIGSKYMVIIGKYLTLFCLKFRIPIDWFIKETIFKQFCGGTSIEKCNHKIKELDKFNIGTILDYSVEGKENELAAENTVNEIKKTIERGSADKMIPFAVFKISGLGSTNLLQKANNKKQLSNAQKSKLEKIFNRALEICEFAYKKDLPVFIDAEESWIQDIIDLWAYQLMKKFNTKKAIVFNTLQMYRIDRLDYLKTIHQLINKDGFIYGIKLVRGAYMEKERKRAIEQNYPSPIQVNKANTDKDFNDAIHYIFEHRSDFSLCVGSHNEKSNLLLANLMEKNNINKSESSFYFAQLLGMSDHISFNLSHLGYKVAKYVPYGPIREVMPYLFRRADENTSVSGQTSRELSLIKQEIKRRKEKN